MGHIPEHLEMIIGVIYQVISAENRKMRKAFIEIFSFTPDEDTDNISTLSSGIISIESNIQEKFQNYLLNNPLLDIEEQKEYFYKILKGVFVAFIESDFIPYGVKYSYCEYEINRMKNFRFIHGSLKIFDEWEEYAVAQKERFKQANESIELLDYFKPKKFPTFIDSDLLVKLDEALRPDFIDNSSIHLMPVFFIRSWKKNTPGIKWKAKQNSLLYLVFRLNGWKRDIPGGKLSHFISLTFMVKGKEVTEPNVSKALSKISSQYNSPETDIIETLLKSIQA